MQPGQQDRIGGGYILHQGVCGRHIRGLLDLAGIDPRATQKSGFFIGVVVDDFEKQADRLAAVADELHEQPALVVQFGPPVRRRRQLSDPCGAKILARDGRADPRQRLLQAVSVQPLIGQDSHDQV